MLVLKLPIPCQQSRKIKICIAGDITDVDKLEMAQQRTNLPHLKVLFDIKFVSCCYSGYHSISISAITENENLNFYKL